LFAAVFLNMEDRLAYLSLVFSTNNLHISFRDAENIPVFWDATPRRLQES
jgi:hypothetical protein